MTQPIRLLVLATCLVQPACADPDHRIGQIEFVDGERPGRRDPARPPPIAPPAPPVPPPPSPPVGAFTEDGDVAVVDGDSGAVLGASPATASSSVRDVAYDPWSRRLVVFESDAEEQGGEIAEYGLTGSDESTSVLERQHRAWVDGIARIGASPLGILVFEDGYGPRWKVLWNDGTPSQGTAASRPASMWTTVHSSGFMIHALTYGEAGLPPALDRRRAEVHPDQLLDPGSEALGLAPSGDPPTSRLVPTPALGDAALLDLEGGVPTLRLVDAAGAAPPVPLDVGRPIGRIEHVVGLQGGEVLVALTSSPTGLLAVRIAPNGASDGHRWLELPGSARVEAQFYSRDLAALGDWRVIAATDEGLFAADLDLAPDGPELALDPDFDGHALRGPLDPIVAPPP